MERRSKVSIRDTESRPTAAFPSSKALERFSRRNVEPASGTVVRLPPPVHTAVSPRGNLAAELVAAEPKLSVAFILLNEFTLFAFSGFVDALRIAGDELDNSRQRECRWTVIAPTLEPVRANCGVSVTPWEILPDPTRFDYVVVIGGRMQPQRNTDERILRYLQRAAARGVAIVGVCTATFVLARAGIMEGRRCCVHWNARNDFELEFPGLAVESDTVFVEEGNHITCPGGQSAADVALHLIERHCGAASARKAAAGMVLEDIRCDRTPQPHAEALWFGTIHNRLVRRAVTLMDRFISKDLSITEIAQRLQVSNNTLYRTFKETMGESPARFFRIMRLAHAHWSLHHTNLSIVQIAHVYRFSDASHFTRLHRLLYGMPPGKARAAGEQECRVRVQSEGPPGIVGQVLAGGLFIFY